MKDFNKKRRGFFSEEAQKERIHLHNKYTPKMRDWDFVDSAKLDGYIFKFDYETDGYRSSLYLPVLNLLPEVEFTPEAEVSKPKNILSYIRGLISKPFASVSLGVAAFVGVCKTALDLNKYRMGTVAYNSVGMHLRVAGLALSLAYIGCAIFAYVILPVLRKRLTAHFDYIENDLHCILPSKSEDIWNNHLIRLPLIYSIILNRYFPGNRDLKWRFYYLDARCYEARYGSGCGAQYSKFNLALEYSDTADQRFSCLRRIINSSELAHSRVRCEMDFEENIKTYVDQISSASKLHQELAMSLRSKLQDCLSTLVSRNKFSAIQKFNAINFDAYSKKAYPGATILYYQLDSVLSLLRKDNRLFDGYDPCDGSRLGVPGHSFCVVRENIDKYYKHLSLVMYNFAYNFCDFKSALPSEFKPKPGKPIITLANSNKHFKILSIDSDENLNSAPGASVSTRLELL